MAVISKLVIDGENKTNHENLPISEIEITESAFELYNLPMGIYHFAENTEGVRTLEDAVNEPIIDLKISGNSVQESENLFDKTTMLSGFLPATGAYPTTNTSYPNAAYQIIDIKAGETFKITYTGSDATSGRIRCIDNDTNEVVGSIVNLPSEYYTTTAKYDNGYVDGNITALKDFKLGVVHLFDLPSDFNLQIVSTVPTQETPIEIESVGDKTKNLFDVSKTLTTAMSSIEGTTIIISKVDTSMATQIANNPILEPNTTYTISCDVEGDFTGRIYRFFGNSLFASSVKNGRYVYTQTTGDDGTFPSDKNGFAVFQNTGSDADMEIIGNFVKISNIQIEKDTTATSYEPYGYKIPIKVSGKNLLNHDFRYTSVGGITVTYNNDGSISFNGVATQALSLYLTRTSFTLPAGTYTLNNPDASCRAYTLPHYYTGTFTLNEDTVVTGVYVNVPNGANLNFTFYPQLEEGSIETKYEPYVVPKEYNIYLKEPLRKLDDYIDYIDYKNKKVVRNVRSLTLNIADMNNTEAYPGWKNVDVIKQDYDLINANLIQVTSVLCNVCENDAVGVNTIGTNKIIIIKSTLTQTEWKTTYPNLQANICYGLASSIEEKIDIPEISTTKGTNIFNIDATIQPSEIKINYWKQI